MDTHKELSAFRQRDVAKLKKEPVVIECVPRLKGLIHPAGTNRSTESLTGDRWPLSFGHKGTEYGALANTNGRDHVTLEAVFLT